MSKKSKVLTKIDYEEKKLVFEQMDIKKFMQSSKMRFKDGSLVYVWFNYHILNIKRSSDELSLSIIKQYQDYQAMQEEKKKQKEEIFLKKLGEFEKASIEKFDTSSSLKFSDGYFMAAWFRNNRKKIENRNDELSLSIMKQYYECKPLRRLIKLNFEDKLNEFERASLDKFDESKEMKFSDDTYMIIWFRNHKTELEKRNDELSNNILNQYLLARKQRKNYDAKLMEFYSADLSKFNIALSKKFSDGTVMSFWYYNNRVQIKNSNDDISKEIVRQHEEYINGNKSYVDDSLDDIKKINK